MQFKQLFKFLRSNENRLAALKLTGQISVGKNETVFACLTLRLLLGVPVPSQGSKLRPIP